MIPGLFPWVQERARFDVDAFFSWQRLLDSVPVVLSGLPLTCLIVVFSFSLAVLLAVPLAIARIRKIPVLNGFLTVVISFIRGTPEIVQLFVVYNGLPLAVMAVSDININRWPPYLFVCITYGLNYAAFMSEVIRSSILSIPAGQTEAGYSVGLTGFETFSWIVAPQAFKIALPSLSTYLIGMFHGTSLAYLIGVVDIMGKVKSIEVNTNHSIEAYTAAAAIFICISCLLEWIFTRLNALSGSGRTTR